MSPATLSVAIALLVAVPHTALAWTVLVGDNATASDLQIAIQPSNNLSFEVAPSNSILPPSFPSVDIVIGTGSHNMTALLESAPQLRNSKLYQYLYTG